MFREDVSRNFGFLLNDVARLLRVAYDRRVRSLGLTRSQLIKLSNKEIKIRVKV
jgi:hypothetical protein